MGFSPAAFSFRVHERHDSATKILPQLSPDAAASAPDIFLTAYNAVVDLGHICCGKTILIHRAACSAGLAAV
jgi:polyketide synthase 12